jgi:transposase
VRRGRSHDARAALQLDLGVFRQARDDANPREPDRTSAKPLASVETSFAIDSTGFGTAVYRRWFDAKYGKEMSEATWLKAHAMVGVTTNIVTSISVTDSNGADSPELPGLVASTAQRFALAEVSADKAYLGHTNLAAIEAVGAMPFVPFKSNSIDKGSPAWRRMWAHFLMRQEDFLAHYHRRSNVEATFSAIKRKFGGAVRSKRYTARVNEILCKILCHNLTVLVHAMFELAISPSFATPVAS